VFDYLASREDANQLIEEFGQLATLERPTWTGPKHDPEPGEPERFQRWLVVDPDGFKVNEVDGARILATDKKILLAVGDTELPLSTDFQLIIGGEPHAIVDFWPVAPAGVTVFWTVQARK